MTDDAVRRAQDEAAAALAAVKKAQAEADAAVQRAEKAAAQAAAAAEQGAPADRETAEPAPQAAAAEPRATPGPLGDDAVQRVATGYAFSGSALEMGALVNGDARADIKGDLSGIASPGENSPKLKDRTRSIGQDWQSTASPTEYFALGGIGHGIPIRATVSGFGPVLLSRVLGLNATQESSLGLVFHYADTRGLPLLDLRDLRAVLTYLTTDDGKQELKDLGGLSSATVGVILRELISFADQGADVFFGEPEIDTADFIRTTADGRGIVSLLEVPGVQDKPKLVFFFDEAHLLFRNASKDFPESITQTVRLIRSKGVGIFFVTQTPKDVPSAILAQVGSRVQHQLRAHTPDDAKALRATVSTYPTSDYDLGELLTSLSIGEAVVTVMNEKGAPTPVAWTRLRAPEGSMDPTPEPRITATIAASPLLAKYGTAIDRDSAREMLARRMDAAAAVVEAVRTAEEQAASAKDAAAEHAQAEHGRILRQTACRQTTRSTTTTRQQKSPLEQALGSPVAKSIINEVVRGVFGTRRRR